MKARRDDPNAAIGLSAVILGTIASGCSGIFVQEIHLSAIPITFYRLWMGAALLGVLLLVRQRPLSPAALCRMIPAGLLLGLDIVLFFCALMLTSVAVATVIGALQPVLVLVVAGRLFGEPIRPHVVIWTLVSIIGIAAVAFGPGVPSGDRLVGDALAAGSLVAFSGYWLVSKHVMGTAIDAERYTFGVMLVAAVAMTPVMLLAGEPLGPTRPIDWYWLVLLALVPSLGHLLWNVAHRFVDVSISSVISAGNPIVASLLALGLLGEPLDAIQAVGGIIAVLAIGVVARETGRPSATHTVSSTEGVVSCRSQCRSGPGCVAMGCGGRRAGRRRPAPSG